MNMSYAGMLFAFGFLLLVTAIIISLIVWAASATKARAAASREASYRELAEKTSLDAAEVKASLTEIKARVAAVERMLKERD